MVRRILGLAIVATCAFWMTSAPAEAQVCSYPNGSESTLQDLLNVIEIEPACALPWPVLKRLARDPNAVSQLNDVYDRIPATRPDRAFVVVWQKALVGAAAGATGPLLEFYDRNLAAHPEDKSLPNASCWIRGMTGIDLEHALPFCDAAVANGRPSYSLVNRGVVKLQLQLHMEAMRDFGEALEDRSLAENDKFLATALYGRGLARVRTGDRRGMEDIRKATKLNSMVEADFAAIGLKP